jgi:hypothetical protein
MNCILLDLCQVSIGWQWVLGFDLWLGFKVIFLISSLLKVCNENKQRFKPRITLNNLKVKAFEYCMNLKRTQEGQGFEIKGTNPLCDSSWAKTLITHIKSLLSTLFEFWEIESKRSNEKNIINSFHPMTTLHFYTWLSTLFDLLPNYFINKKGPMNPPFMLDIHLNPTRKNIKNNVGIIIWSFIWTTLWYIIGVHFKLITFLTFVHGFLKSPQQIGVGHIWRHSFETLDEF